MMKRTKEIKIKTDKIFSHEQLEISKKQEEKAEKFSISKLPDNIFFRYGIALFLFAFFFVNYYSKIEFYYNVRFGFDIWEYQSMAVNMAKGHGISKFGAIENYEEYKFENYRLSDNGSPEKFVKDAGRVNYYRTPGYPFFMGAIYSIFGVYPEKVQKIQAILILLIYAFLPVFAYALWGKIGFLSGIPASLISAEFGGVSGTAIMTEPLILIYIFIFALAWLFDFKKKSVFSNIIFGIATGGALLVKGSFIFIPLIVLAIKLYFGFKEKDKMIAIKSLLYIVFIALSVMPWSFYASKHAGKTVILSTQGEDVLLDTHNEYAKGGWSPEWAADKKSFYNNDNMKDKSAYIRVLNFYTHFPMKLPELAIQKIVFGFIPFLYLWLIFGLLIVENIRLLIEKFLKIRILEYIFLLLIGIPFIFSMIYFKHKNYIEFYEKIPQNMYYIFAVFVLPFIFPAVRKILKIKSEFKFETPQIFVILFINFLLLTAILLGEIADKGNRYIIVTYYIMITFFCYLLFSYIHFLYKKYTKRI